MDFLPRSFEPMAQYQQFVVYKLILRTDGSGKYDKIPVNPSTLKLVSAHDSTEWMDATQAIITAKDLGEGYGVGFAFTDNDPFWFLDIDGAFDGQWSQLACDLVSTFSGAALELSTSRRGLHIIGTGSVPTHTTQRRDLGLEFYTTKRFVALTGYDAQGDASLDCTRQVRDLVAKYFSGGSEASQTGDWKAQWDAAVAEGVEPTWCGSTDDNELLRRMLQSEGRAQVLGGKASFQELYERDLDALQKYFPDANHPDGFDESAADAAICQHLMFWTGRDVVRTQRFMMQSELRREKYDRVDYLPRTITVARGRSKNWLQDKPTTPPQTSMDVIGQPRIRAKGNTFLSGEQQKQHFDGCVYIRDEHRVLVPGGDVLDGDRFKVWYGGYSFAVNAENSAVTKNAFEAFTQSHLHQFPQAKSAGFRPDLAPAIIYKREEEEDDPNATTLVNVYWPVRIKRIKGDVTPFLNHLAKVLPDPRDQLLLLAYMAACIQYQGTKFQWCPLLQGVQGNGKTLFTLCVAFAIGRRHCHFPKASEITSKFNVWQYGKTFIGVEDIDVPANRRETIEIMKPMITGKVLELEPKGRDKVLRDICCNYILNTNHKDGLRKVTDDRRFAPFYTAQQSVADLKRDGMDREYFSKLYGWLRNEEGFEKVAEFLFTYEIPEEYGLKCLEDRAPDTSTTAQAIEHGRGRIEQEIIEAAESGRNGFKGGWISSIALNRLLTELKADSYIPQNKRRELLESLGYVRHPALTDGRLDSVLGTEGGKPRLYVRTGSAEMKLTSNAEVRKAYITAQEKTD